MNFEHYKNFVAIIDAGTISAASKELMIAQPALSNQIKSLEDTYGAPLVIRKPRHIELTDAGKILYEKIKSICYLEDSAKKEISACVAGNRGTLWLGTSPANPDPLLYQILLDYHEAYPEVSFEIFERNSGIIIESLQAGMLEVGVIRAQPHILPPDIRPVLTIQEKMMAYFHQNHALLSPSMEQIPMRYLKELPISISQGLRRGFTAACEQEGFKPYYMNISASRSTSRLWAADQRTVSIMAASAPFNDGDFCLREIAADGLITQRMFAVARNRRLSAVSETFLQFCRSHPLMERWMQGAPIDSYEHLG
ncbi:hypothetical protein CRH03_07495 [Clostridium sp. HMb25]|nr:hypothetical protein CRH03_07495 [Clostridium sp. HMb25]